VQSFCKQQQKQTKQTLQAAEKQALQSWQKMCAGLLGMLLPHTHATPIDCSKKAALAILLSQQFCNKIACCKIAY
jgi:hypothetical protein